MTYGERLEQVLKQSGKSRRELAAHLGITVQAVGQVVRGESTAFNAERHVRTALFLECDSLYLVTGEHSKPSPIMEAWQRLSPDRRERLLDTARDMLAGQTVKPTAANPFPHLPTPKTATKLK